MTILTKTSIRNPATHLDLDGLPEDVVGEIIGGELHVHPRPDEPHGRVLFELIVRLGSAFHRAISGPGGWFLLGPHRLQLDAQTILRPDLAGWRRENFRAAPDWICDILSPSTARHDRVRKLPIYAEHEVRHAWLIDPALRTLEVLRLEAGAWMIVSAHEEDEKVRAEPFDAVEVDLAQLWGEALPPDEPELDDTAEA